MRKLIVDNFKLPLELDIALTCAKDNEIELDDNWIILNKKDYEIKSKHEELPYYVTEGIK